jgi:ubiquitin-conjugating enzyme E2 Z
MFLEVKEKEVKEKRVILDRNTVNRLFKDIKEIMTTPLESNGIYYHHDEDHLLRGYAMIVGPQGTPYFGGYYFFQLNYPEDYPHSPPVVTYDTNGDNIRFNPNLYKCGKVCVSLLNTWKGPQWSSCNTISTILLTLCTLFTKEPLLNEPGFTRFHYDFKKYHEILEYKCIEIAFFRVYNEIVNSSTTISFKPYFSLFREQIMDLYSKNIHSILDIVEERKKKFTQPVFLKTYVYNMSCIINYSLFHSLKPTLNPFETEEKLI